MATDGPTPKPCNTKIYTKGQTVCVLGGSSNMIEDWVQLLAKKSKAKVDWHYAGGRANVLHLGSDESRQRVLREIEDLKDNFSGQFLIIHDC